MSSNVSLDPLWITVMPVYQHVVGIGTQALSALAFYLMVTKTPKPGRPFARYLMLLQASISIVDFNFGFLLCPIGLYPLFGGLCKGALCTVFGCSAHVGIVLMQLTAGYVAVAILFCFHFKYLAILEMTRRRQISYSFRILYRVVTLLIFTISCLLYIPLYRNLEFGPEFARKTFPSLYYLFEDPSYNAFAYDPTYYPEYALLIGIATAIMMIYAILSGSFFIFGSFYFLSQKNTNLSDKTIQLQRKMMWLLVVQTLVPLTIQLGPFGVYFYSMATASLSPDFNNAVFCLQMTHAIAHTSIAILTTPSYRKPLIFWNKQGGSSAVTRLSITVTRRISKM